MNSNYQKAIYALVLMLVVACGTGCKVTIESPTGSEFLEGEPIHFAAEYSGTSSISWKSEYTAPDGSTQTISETDFRQGVLDIGKGYPWEFSKANLPVGIHLITAYHSDDTDTISLVVLAKNGAGVPTQTTLSSNISSSSYGEEIELTAIVGGQCESPIGHVLFIDGSFVLGVGELDTDARTSFTTRELNVGMHELTAVYLGDSTCATSTSFIVDHEVIAAIAEISVRSSQSPSQIGENVIFTAFVTAPISSGTPTGSVTFFDGTDEIHTTALDGAGEAALNIATFTVGTHEISAHYNGSTKHTTAASEVLYHTVALASTRIVLSSSHNPASYGESVTFTATVVARSEAGPFIGSVTFFDGTEVLGELDLDATGHVSLEISDLKIGAHIVTAKFDGDETHTQARSEEFTQTINAGPPDLALAASASPSRFGETVTFAVTASTPPGANMPEGTVTFNDGSSVIGTASFDDAGVAFIETSALAAGGHLIVAAYEGSVVFDAAKSEPIFHVVVPAEGGTTLTSTLNASRFGDAVTFTATVVGPAGTGIPIGAVTFRDGTAILGLASLNTSGEAAITTTALAVGDHEVTAMYGGSEELTASTSEVLIQVVERGLTTVSMVLAPTVTHFGERVDLATSVQAPTGTGAPTGWITFYDNAENIGAAAVDTNGNAALAISEFTVGEHALEVSYSGNDALEPASSEAMVLTVEKAVPTIMLDAAPSLSQFGETTVLRAWVLPPANAGQATGSVTFRDGEDVLGMSNFDEFGFASLETNVLDVGLHSITATYNGSDTLTSVVSGSVEHVVVPVEVSVLIASTPNPARYAETVSFTVTVVTPENGGAPIGAIIFYDGETELTTVELGAHGVALFSTAELAVGPHQIRAVYGGSETWNPAQSDTLTQLVVAGTPGVSLASSVNPSRYAEPVIFSATVMTPPGAPIPTGTVMFMDGTSLLGIVALDLNGRAPLEITLYSYGVHTIGAAYSGDGNFDYAQADVIQQSVLPSEGGTSLVSSQNPSPWGASLTFTSTVLAFVGEAIPTGEVTFKDGDDILATVELDEAGEAVFETSELAIGTHAISAYYGGCESVDPSQSDVLDQEIVVGPPQLNLISSLNPSNYQELVCFEVVATGPPGYDTPTGIVTFYDGYGAMGMEYLDNSGVASLCVDFLLPGTTIVTAEYEGDDIYETGTTPGLEQTVVSCPSIVTLTSQANPSMIGEGVGFDIDISSCPMSVLPSGTLTFMDREAIIATADVTFGHAYVEAYDLEIGIHELKAVYSGDEMYPAAQSDVLVQEVIPWPTTTTLFVSGFDPVYGETAHLVAQVFTEGGPLPLGSVTFSHDFYPYQLGTGELDTSGSAILTVPTLEAGVHSLKAIYEPSSSDFATSTGIIEQLIQRAPLSIVARNTPSESSYGEPVSLDIDLNFRPAINVAPSGYIDVYDGATIIASARINVVGEASVTLPRFGAGTHVLSVTYAGDQNFLPVATEVPQIVTRAETVTSILVSPETGVRYGPLTLEIGVASVVSGLGKPTGLVDRITIGDSMDIPGGALNTSGRITIVETERFGNGTLLICTSYLGDDNFLPSEACVEHIVERAPSSIVVTSSLEQPVVGQDVTVTATVASVASPILGTVTFFDDGVAISEAIDVENATLTTSTLSSGNHTITAMFDGGTGAFANAESTPIQIEVQKASTTVSLESSPNPSRFGQTVTLTAMPSVVAFGAETPTGTVTFKCGTVTLGTAEIDDLGIATFRVNTIPTGDHPVTADYEGDNDYMGSTSDIVTQTVEQSRTVVTISTENNPTIFGQPVKIVVNVGASSPGQGIPTGTVTLREGQNILAHASLDSFGEATLSLSSLGGGSHAFVASYSGDDNFIVSTSGAFTQIITPAATTTSISLAYTSPVQCGDTLTMTATVAPVTECGHIPHGTVTFYNNSTEIAIVQLDAEGHASFSTNTLSIGTFHSFSATFNGDTDFGVSTSDSTTGVYVTSISTTTILSSNTNPSMFGQEVRFTASVTASNNFNGLKPTGQIRFTDYPEGGGSNNLGAVDLDATGTATIAISSLSIGTHIIKAQYIPSDCPFSSSYVIINQVVDTATTNVSIESNLSSSVFGQFVTFTATVNSTDTPTGTITFINGDTDLGTGTLDDSGITILSTDTLSVGSHSITAIYGGDGTHTVATSGTITQNVEKADTWVELTSSLNPSSYTQSVTLTAQVHTSDPGGGIASGAITFIDTQSDTDVVVAINASGVATLTTDTFAVSDEHWITAAYSGDANMNISSSDSIQQVVQQASTLTTIASDANPSTYGASVTFTATVTSSVGAPTGTVYFQKDTTVLGSGMLDDEGHTTWTTASLSAGSHAITAVYEGAGNFSSSTSEELQQDVGKAFTTTAIDITPTPSSYGSNVRLRATVTGEAAIMPSGTVAFKDRETTIGTATLDLGGRAELVLNTLNMGDHRITTVYGGDERYASSTSTECLHDVSKAATAITIAATPNPANVGSEVTFTITVVSGGGIPTGTVSYSDSRHNGGAAVDLPLDGTGKATVMFQDLRDGMHTCSATYLGNANFDWSSTTDFTLEVVQAELTISATDESIASPLHAGGGETISLTAVLTDSFTPLTDSIVWLLGAGSSGTFVETATTTVVDGKQFSTIVYQAPANVGLPDTVIVNAYQAGAMAPMASASVSIKTDPPTQPDMQPFNNGVSRMTRVVDFAMFGQSILHNDKNISLLAPYSAHGKFTPELTAKLDQTLFQEENSEANDTKRKIGQAANLDSDIEEETVMLSWEINSPSNLATLSILDKNSATDNYDIIQPQLLNAESRSMTLDVEPDCGDNDRLWETPDCWETYDYDLALADLDDDGYAEVIITGTIVSPLHMKTRTQDLVKPGMMWIFDDMQSSGSGQLRLLSQTRLDGEQIEGIEYYRGMLVARVAAGGMRKDRTRQIAVAWIDWLDWKMGWCSESGNRNVCGIDQVKFQIFDGPPTAPTPLGGIGKTDEETTMIGMSGNLATSNILGIAMADLDGDKIKELIIGGWSTSWEDDVDADGVHIQLEVRASLETVPVGLGAPDLPIVVDPSASPLEYRVEINQPPSRWLQPLYTFASPSSPLGGRVQHIIAGNHIASIGQVDTSSPVEVLWDNELPTRSSTVGGVKYADEANVQSLFDAPDYYQNNASCSDPFLCSSWLDVRAGDVNGDARDDVIAYWNGGDIDVWGWTCADEEEPCELDWNEFYNKSVTPSIYGGANAILVPTAVDEDSTVIEYTGENYVVYTSNKVIALLAAAPVVNAEIETVDGCQPVQDNEIDTHTGFATFSSSGSSSGFTAGFHAGFIVGMDVEISVGFICNTVLSAFRATMDTQFELTHTSETSVETTIEVDYVQGYSDDGVIFSTMPYTRFVYTITSSLDENSIGKTVYIDVPMSPQIMLVDREIFNNVVNLGSYQITDDLLSHAAGDLRTYPPYSEYPAETVTSEDPIDLYNGVAVYSTIEPITYAPQTSGQSPPLSSYGSAGSNAGMSISRTWTEMEQWEQNLTQDFAAEVNVSGFVAGVNLGWSVGGYQTTTMSNGISFSSSVGSIINSAYTYLFRLYAYKQTLTDEEGNVYQSFYVANYGVDPSGSAYNGAPPAEQCD